MKLTDNEIRDITRHLEAGKPLPEKYRFLLFEDKKEVELTWNGKTGEVCNVVLPFQTIEHVDEPRAEKDIKLQGDLFDPITGRQLEGWTNKLIWGDNKLVLSSLKNGSLREEIEKQGGIKLIYIDPPFDVGANFSMDIEIGGDTFTKKPNILEEIAYRDTWGKGADSFIAMIHERLVLMRDLLADDGSIYVHCDWRVNGYIRLVLDEVFGNDLFVNEIIWKRGNPRGNATRHFSYNTDTIFIYGKTKRFFFKPQYGEHRKEYLIKYYNQVDKKTGKRFQPTPLIGHAGTNPVYEWKGFKRPWRYPIHRLNELEKDGRIYRPESGEGVPRYKKYIDETEGRPVQSLWEDVFPVNSQAIEDTHYPTQKSESLLERIIKASSNEGDLIADFFCGSGTTLAVAEKLNRKWIGSDLGKFGIHTTRKRMIGVQRKLKAENKTYRAFEILNLGKYERQHYVGLNEDLREAEKRKQLERKEAAFLELILHAYRAESTTGFTTFQGKKAGRLVAVGPVNLPVTRLFVEEIILECRQKHITRVDILAFEFEMGLFPNIQEEAKNKGIDLALKYIPPDVFDKRAVEKNQVVFHDVSYIEVKPLCKGKSIAIKLTDFSVFYSQDSSKKAEEALKKKGNKIIVEKGQIIKIIRDKDGIITREVLTKKWTDWIDYWSVDFDFESKREIIRIKKEETGKYEEVWTGDYVFENEWQSFRTKKDRSLELTSVYHECTSGRRKVAVKVVDIFGNDTMKVIEVKI